MHLRQLGGLAPQAEILANADVGVIDFPSSARSHWRATEGMCFVPVYSQNRSLSADTMRFPFSLSPGPVNPRRQVPPYFPISWTGLMTSGSSGTRCSTGGSFPCFTSSASMGASLKVFGHFAGSRISSGPSSLPISWAPSFGAGAPVPCAPASRR